MLGARGGQRFERVALGVERDPLEVLQEQVRVMACGTVAQRSDLLMMGGSDMKCGVTRTTFGRILLRTR